MNCSLHVVIVTVIVISTAAHSAEPIHIGSRRELFVDRYLIDQLDGARLQMHRPQPREVAIRFDRPWELESPGYATIVRDVEQGIYRMYYRSTLTPPSFGKKRDTPRRQVTCYAESQGRHRMDAALAGVGRIRRLEGQQHHVGGRRFA